MVLTIKEREYIKKLDKKLEIAKLLREERLKIIKEINDGYKKYATYGISSGEIFDNIISDLINKKYENTKN